jgi:preprotein translocase subunit SecF
MSAGGAAAAAAAAAQQLREQEEEQEMTPYQPQDLNDGWEFKILRSLTGAFGKPEKLREFLDDEAKAGWVLVEKFDNNRIRLKRPASARKTDSALEFDPYRTYVGISAGKLATRAIVIALGISLLIIAVVVGIVAAFHPGGRLPGR